MNFFELYMAVLLANLTIQVIAFFAGKLYFEHIMNSWLNNDDEVHDNA